MRSALGFRPIGSATATVTPEPSHENQGIPIRKQASARARPHPYPPCPDSSRQLCPLLQSCLPPGILSVIDIARLLADLKRLLPVLEEDMRLRFADESELDREFRQ